VQGTRPRHRTRLLPFVLATILGMSLLAAPAATAAPGNAVEDLAGCLDNVLPANDDLSTGEIALPFSFNFFGVEYSSLWVNNNGNVTFDAPLGTFTPFDLLTTAQPIIAPFFADVDTRVGPVVTYGEVTFEGSPAFCVNWRDVGYYSESLDKTNDFQLLLVDRSPPAGDIDVIFNYNRIEWETGDASGGSGGLGGSSARAGYSNGVDTAFELPGSAVNGAFLDSNLATGLIYNSLNSDIEGRYIWSFRGGTPDPEPDCVELIAGAGGGDGTVVGDVCVINDADELTVRYRTVDGWLLTETHLHVAPLDGSIPVNRPGNPQVGLFAHSEVHDPPVDTYTYTLDHDAEPDDVLTIAAHADVELWDGMELRSEGAWGDGMRFVPRGNWATYFTYTVR
jgi:hypothetical protein